MLYSFKIEIDDWDCNGNAVIDTGFLIAESYSKAASILTDQYSESGIVSMTITWINSNNIILATEKDVESIIEFNTDIV